MYSCMVYAHHRAPRLRPHHTWPTPQVKLFSIRVYAYRYSKSNLSSRRPMIVPYLGTVRIMAYGLRVSAKFVLE